MKNINYNFEEGTEILKRLIQFETINPPGNEHDCIYYINSLLKKEGFETQIIEKSNKRLNLITKLKGKKKTPPLLLYGHIDVVPVKNQNWKFPPFSATESDGYLWGRGTLDMKAGVAMMITALINLKRSGFVPAGDIIFAALSDEEAGGTYGAEFLVNEHPHLFKDVKFALGEFGGFPIYIGGKKFYAIQVAEKQVCWLQGTLNGQGSHASFPMRNGVMGKLGRILTILNENRLPYHLLTSVEKMFQIMSDHSDMPFKKYFKELTNPDKVVEALEKMGQYKKLFEAVLHNTVNTTVIRSGEKINIVPSKVSLKMDARLLPGFTDTDVINEIQKLTGKDLHLKSASYASSKSNIDLGLFENLSKIITDLDPEGIPIPLVLSATTDARHFAKLGIQTYGFIPMNLPEGFDLIKHIHAADERIPIDAYHFGITAMQNAIMQYDG
ncbi:MAG: M20/M25/M40 family metallo-hydrolase [Bacteroidota bacterium]